MKKYIMIGGKKHYIEEEKKEAVAPETPVAPKEDAPQEDAPKDEPKEDAPKDGADDVESQAKKIGEAIADSITAKLDLGQKKDEKKISSKVAEMLNGKDLSDKDALTADEKIVGFYHALVTNDKTTCKALSEGTAADGGYLFPDEFRAELIKTLTGPFTMRGLVRVIPMRRDVMKIPSLVSRPKVTWTAENETKSTTTAHFGEETLTARKLAAILYSSDELVEDSTDIDVVRTIIDLFAEAMRDEEDKVICQGNGTTQPTGLTTARAAGTIAGRTCAGNLDFDDIIDTYYDLPQAYRQAAKWIVATANIKELRKIKDSDGRYIWQDSIKEGEPARMLGKAVIEQDYVGEANIFFGNYKLGYWLGDRKQMTVKISQETETAFTKDQTAIRVVERIAGTVVLGDAIRALISIP